MANIDFDDEIEEINKDIDNMASNKDIKKTIDKYNLTNKKILDLRTKLENIQKELEENKYDGEQNSEELICDKEFIEYLDELDNFKNNLNNNLKLDEIIEIYKNSVSKINKCRDYLENQKIEVINID